MLALDSSDCIPLEANCKAKGTLIQEKPVGRLGRVIYFTFRGESALLFWGSLVKCNCLAGYRLKRHCALPP